MPAMIVWPVSGSTLTRKVGSSWTSLASAAPSFSWSALVLGSMARRMTGSGKSIDSSSDRVLLVADRVAGRDASQADHGGDVARTRPA